MYKCQTYKEYIQPIGECGIGFIASEKLFTAAHVIVEMGAAKFRFKSRLYNPGTHMYHSYNTETNGVNGLDVTIYEGEADSPLKLSALDIEVGAEVECHTWVRVGNGFEYVIVKGMVHELEGNFFSCIMDDIVLDEGNSGSPLLIEDRVIGILHGGRKDTAFCVFQRILPFMLDDITNISYE